MAKINKDDFISGLKEMNVLELNELVKALEEEFEIDLSAVAVAAGPAAASDEEEGSGTVTISIKDPGAAKINVIKAVKEITGLGLKESKEIVDKLDVVKKDIPADEGNEIKAKLEEAGATVEVK